jgi:carboxyl-terminal processing protease
MIRRMIYGLLIAALGLNLLAGARVYFSTAQAATKDSAYSSLELFSYVLEKVRTDYVDGTNLTYQDLVDGALKGMVNTLDPHSEFMTPDEYKQLEDDTQGAFGGLGIVIGMKDNFITVLAPMEDTPGSRAGILSGDRIVKINGETTEKLGLEDTVKKLRGEPGTDVSVTIFRPSASLTKDLKLTRAVIKMDMVKDINGKKQFPLGEDGIGYIRVLQFSEKTSDELETALAKLKGQGMRALVLDLRWNPGGLLEQAVEVSQKFLPRGKLVVTTEGRNPANDSRHYAEGRGDELTGKDGAPLPLVILVNFDTASAAEIVTGCLQDSRRDTIVLGEKTFGKGSVQSIFPMDDGSALKLTIAKYYTPSHKVIHEHGIVPDITVPLTDDEERDVILKRSPGGVDMLDEQDRARVKEAHDLQLDRATDLLKGLMLYAERAPAGNPPAAAPEKLAAKQTASPNR